MRLHFPRPASLPLMAFLSCMAKAEPTPTQFERAEKIAAGLNLGNDARQERTRAVIARFYEDLDALQADDPKKAELKRTFEKELSADLTPAQIGEVKDGLTYQVVPKTHAVYREMLPDLTEEQDRRILEWLSEARELAVTAGSAEAKHACFRKFKGRINNYLATQGIDMKQAERDLAERRKNTPASK